MKKDHIARNILLLASIVGGLVLLFFCEQMIARKKTGVVEKNTDIDLFGVEMVGTPHHIIRGLEKNPYLQIDHGPEGFIHQYEGKFSCRVLLEGIPFGMTVTYEKDKEDTVKDIKFITSETDHHVLDVIVKNLKDYYGEPEIIDMPEEYYKWFPRGHFLHARRLHHDDGGWTFYIEKNQ